MRERERKREIKGERDNCLHVWMRRLQHIYISISGILFSYLFLIHLFIFFPHFFLCVILPFCFLPLSFPYRSLSPLPLSTLFLSLFLSLCFYLFFIPFILLTFYFTLFFLLVYSFLKSTGRVYSCLNKTHVFRSRDWPQASN